MSASVGLDRLTELHRADALAERYAEVPALLAGLSGDELTRAGRLLDRVDPDAVVGVPAVSVAITGNGTLATLTAPLTAEIARHGLLARTRLGDFGSWVTDLSDPGGDLLGGAPHDLVLCVLDHRVVFDEVPTPWRWEDVAEALAAKIALLGAVAARHTTGTLVLNTLPLPHTVAAQLVDLRARARLGAVWREANARLLRLVEDHPAVVVIDLDTLLTEPIAASDSRLSAYVNANLSPDLLARYARQVGHLARNATGRTKKVLALDLDDTVWGGVLGEVGPDGVEVGDTYRGEAFTAFQRVAGQLAAQGVLLAAVSKNDPEVVRETLRTHPRLALREDDFVRVAANWRPKHDNLTELAADLNLGVDSLVFVDDSSYECGLVRHALPGVAVVQVDAEPALHVEKLLRDGWFDVPRVTDEDLARPARYRDELARADFLQSFPSLEDYLAQLGVWVHLGGIGPADVPRVSQMTLRTNQFNLTTRRLQQADVAALLEDPAATVYGIRSGDRFGDNGLVGAVFTRRAGASVEIENFLLSCRVFARGVEQAALSGVLRRARDAGAAEVLARHVPSAKNGKVAEFYPHNGFTEIARDGSGAVFRHDLARIDHVPDHVRDATTAEGILA
ncbi:HAD-IIIC family phosphatase [Actinosynnema sp. CS-041913]|uniref:HAD-IIIC family phosphatase n=1 Tax=Actinosynnema sp. CS-041913 TaxID=3239917 RepID=UPI003D8D2403